jgi:2,4'-dihydroxyacetophenone dioxygenase
MKKKSVPPQGRQRSQEILIDKLDPKGWVKLPNTGGIRIYKLWVNPKNGAHFCLLDVPKGGTVPIRHRHASNQFMYCLKGRYEYVNPGRLVLKPGSFYMNPKGNYHGPTIAKTRCLLLEAYDGPHYFEAERPSFHTKKTLDRTALKASAKKRVARRSRSSLSRS